MRFHDEALNKHKQYHDAIGAERCKDETQSVGVICMAYDFELGKISPATVDFGQRSCVRSFAQIVLLTAAILGRATSH